MEANIIYNIDCLTGLRNLPDDSIDCCVTSPPYFNLRDYGVSGQIGLEDTPEQYIQKLVGVFHEVRRVLAPAGTLWVNIGDCYAGSGKGAANYPDNAMKYKQGTNRGTVGRSAIVKKFDGYKSKDLIGIPWMLAFALRADGWFLRQDIIWAKPNPMPESMKDRCTKSHEYIFLLTKSPKYYFDCEAIHEKAVTSGTIPTNAPRYGGNKYTATPEKFYRTKSGNAYIDREFRNKRDVWTIPTQPLQIDEPAPTLTTKDRLAFVDMQYGNGTPCDIETPAPTVTTNPKHQLVTCKPWIMNTSFKNTGSSIDEPAQTVTANRKWHYLMNPQFQSAGGSVDSPCFTLIARMDKMPPYLIQTEQGEMAIVIEPDDSPAMVKIKQFMALYGIIDIKMRMLRIPELKRIMGFPSDYVLVGTQADQKKFIGNAVEVNMARVLCEALCARLIEEDIKPIRAAA